MIMKKVLLVCAGLLIGLTTATATEQNNTTSKIKLEKKKNYRNAQPIVFAEQGIEFSVFQNGTFDFNTPTNNSFNSNSRRNSINSNNRGPNSNTLYTSNYYSKKSISISRDRTGKINRIGNVYLNYDRYGRLTRVGSILMNYDRGANGDLTNVGGLKVEFNRKGQIIKTHGHVKQIIKTKQHKNYKR